MSEKFNDGIRPWRIIAAQEAKIAELEETIRALEGESLGRKRTLEVKADEVREEWTRAENAEGEIESLRTALSASEDSERRLQERLQSSDRNYRRLLDECVKLEELNNKAKSLIDSVRGFREHGEAKGGTHATIMFQRLDEYERKEKKSD